MGLVETSRTVITAIEEKRKWERREEELLKELKEVREEKKELAKKSKELKKKIKECKNQLRNPSHEVDISFEKERTENI